MIPPVQSLASHPDGRRISPAAARNLEPIRAVLAGVAPARGRALEIASGPGQHVAALAAALPGLEWQPSDIDPGNLASIAAWTAWSGQGNIRPTRVLDAGQPGWAAGFGPLDLILVVNLLHLIDIPASVTLITEAAQALAPGGLIAIYGPFLREGRTTSAGDAEFHARLSSEGRGIGYKDRADVQEALASVGLVPRPDIAMPANNLFLLASRPATPPEPS